MRGPPVVLTNTLGRPVTNVISERGAVPMTVVNTLGEPVTLVNSGGEPVTLFNANGTLWDYPFSLFSNNEQGAWYDPSDFSTLFQNSTGTTPVTAVEQPVRLMLDRSRGLVLGGELVTNGGFDSATGWTVPAGWAITGGQAVASATSASLFGGSMTTVSGRWYQVEFDVVSYTSGTLAITVGANYSTNASLTGAAMAAGRKSVLVLGGASTTRGVEFYGGTIAATIDNISVRELPGAHATAPNDASRPVLRARYNQITFSEQFDNAGWAKTGTTITANAAVAPDGTMTADKMVEVAAASTPRVGFGTAATIISAVYTLSVYAQAAERDQIRIVLEGSGSLGPYFLLTGAGSVSGAGSTTSSITNVGNGWYRCVVTYTAGATNPSLYIATASGGAVITSGDNTKGVLLWGAQLLTSADQSATGGAYQRIAAATDYDTSNPVWRPYLAFDGVDDSMATASVDLTSTDKLTLFAGVTKLSDAAAGVVLGHGVDVLMVGAFEFTSNTGANATTGFRGRSTAGSTAQAGITRNVASPSTFVFVGLTDYAAAAGSEFSGRYNTDVQVQNNGGAQENTGTFGNNVLTVGSRQGGASQRYNGRLYSLAVLGRTATAAEIGAMEAWVNGKTGAF